MVEVVVPVFWAIMAYFSYLSTLGSNEHRFPNRKCFKNFIISGPVCCLWIKTSEDIDLCAMTVADQNRLDEVLAANRIWAEMDNVDTARHQHGSPSKLEMVNMADGAIRRMIKMVKCIEHFRKMDHHDQIQLLKSKKLC